MKTIYIGIGVALFGLLTLLVGYVPDVTAGFETRNYAAQPAGGSTTVDVVAYTSYPDQPVPIGEEFAFNVALYAAGDGVTLTNTANDLQGCTATDTTTHSGNRSRGLTLTVRMDNTTCRILSEWTLTGGSVVNTIPITASVSDATIGTTKVASFGNPLQNTPGLALVGFFVVLLILALYKGWLFAALPPTLTLPTLFMDSAVGVWTPTAGVFLTIIALWVQYYAEWRIDRKAMAGLDTAGAEGGAA